MARESSVTSVTIWTDGVVPIAGNYNIVVWSSVAVTCGSARHSTARAPTHACKAMMIVTAHRRPPQGPVTLAQRVIDSDSSSITLAAVLQHAGAAWPGQRNRTVAPLESSVRGATRPPGTPAPATRHTRLRHGSLLMTHESSLLRRRSLCTWRIPTYLQQRVCCPRRPSARTVALPDCRRRHLADRRRQHAAKECGVWTRRRHLVPSDPSPRCEIARGMTAHHARPVCPAGQQTGKSPRQRPSALVVKII